MTLPAPGGCAHCARPRRHHPTGAWPGSHPYAAPTDAQIKARMLARRTITREDTTMPTPEIRSEPGPEVIDLPEGVRLCIATVDTGLATRVCGLAAGHDDRHRDAEGWTWGTEAIRGA